MKILKISLFTLITSVAILPACYYDNEERLYPSLNNACDTTNVTYSGFVRSFLDGYCISCHSNSTASGSIKLQDYTDVAANADLTLKALNGDGVPLMPMGSSSKLDACKITSFAIWIKKGKLNN